MVSVGEEKTKKNENRGTFLNFSEIGEIRNMYNWFRGDGRPAPLYVVRVGILHLRTSNSCQRIMLFWSPFRPIEVFFWKRWTFSPLRAQNTLDYQHYATFRKTRRVRGLMGSFYGGDALVLIARNVVLAQWRKDTRTATQVNSVYYRKDHLNNLSDPSLPWRVTYSRCLEFIDI